MYQVQFFRVVLSAARWNAYSDTHDKLKGKRIRLKHCMVHGTLKYNNLIILTVFLFEM